MPQLSPESTDGTAVRARSSATPQLDRALATLGQTQTRSIWLGGLGALLSVTAAWIAVSFLADWALHVPRGVRFALVAGLAALLFWAARRWLRGPLQERPDAAGLAVLVERQHPELHELLVSSVQLQESPNGSPELVQAVVRDAESRAASLNFDTALDAKPAWKRLGLGSAAAALVAVFAVMNPLHAKIFAQRMLGGQTPWPQRTELRVSIPLPEGSGMVNATAERIDILAPRGTDIPVLVQATGEVPKEVVLDFANGGELRVPESGKGLFRTQLRSVQSDIEFQVEGGDDKDGLPLISIQVLDPPDINRLAMRVSAPDYTGLGTFTRFDQDIQAPVGSHVEVFLLADPPEATGSAQLLPSGDVVTLTAQPFPADEASPATSGASAVSTSQATQSGLGFELDLDSSMRLRFSLADDNGLQNPDPGLFAIEAIADKRPQVEMLFPARAEVETTARGQLLLVTQAKDDYGLSSMAWQSKSGSVNSTPLSDSAGDQDALLGATPAEQPLAFLPVVSEESVSYRASLSVPISELVAVAGLPESSLTEGTQLSVSILAHDNRPSDALSAGDAVEDADSLDPDDNNRGQERDTDPGLGRSTNVRVRLVSEEELLRRIQDRLVRVRGRLVELEDLNRKKSQFTTELLAGLESDDLETLGRTEILPALTGARRVQTDARAIARELAGVAETALYARLDEKADAVLNDLDSQLSEQASKSFEAELWKGLSDRWSGGRLSNTSFAGQLVKLVGSGVELSEEHALNSVLQIDLASTIEVDDDSGLGELHAALTAAVGHQAALQAHIEDLLERLSEWDNLQSILSLTRNILNRQKALEERTRNAAKQR